MNNKEARIAAMQEAKTILIHTGIIIAFGLFLVFLILGTAGFWDPIP